MMARARNWPVYKTAWITFLCGLGHVGSSILIGAIGITVGASIGRLEMIEAIRGDIAAWLLFSFGIIYFIWGLVRAVGNRPHKHWHTHTDGERHAHEHSHVSEHAHRHPGEGKNITPWILFTIFVFGPCEPLIPMLMVPAARHSVAGVILVSGFFSLVTIATMLTIVLLASYGLKFAALGKLERYTHAIAGALIALSAAAILFLGL
jgi:sulfite exporter TauE/SafE